MYIESKMTEWSDCQQTCTTFFVSYHRNVHPCVNLEDVPAEWAAALGAGVEPFVL